jgi:hypothetical protein
MSIDILGTFMPLILGFGFMVIGILYVAMPTESLVKLDRRVERWVQSAPNPYTRIGIVVPAYKGIGGFVAVSGLIYTLISLAKHPLF